MKKLLLVAVLAALGALVGCSDAQFPYLTAIAVTPGTPSVAAGRTQQFTATGTFSNGETRDITSLVTWTSSTTPVSTINSAGLAQSYSQGSSTITATFTGPAAGTVTGTVNVQCYGACLGCGYRYRRHCCHPGQPHLFSDYQDSQRHWASIPGLRYLQRRRRAHFTK